MCTVEDRTDEDSGENGFLLQVDRAWNIGGVRIIGPRLLVRVKWHGLYVREEEGFWGVTGSSRLVKRRP